MPSLGSWLAEAILGGVLFFCVVHVVWWRLRPSDAPRVIRLAALGLLSLGLSLAIYRRHAMWTGAVAAYLASVQLFATVVYLFLYAGIARSVSLTLLIRLRQAEGGILPRGELEREYIASQRFDGRLQQMQAAGWLSISGNRVRLTEQGCRVARLTWALSHLFSEKMEG